MPLLRVAPSRPRDHTRPGAYEVLKADVLAENARMPALARDLGFEIGPHTGDGTRPIQRALRTRRPTPRN
jgi:hypothetical protein